MTDDTARVLTALKAALGAEVSVSVSWPERGPECPAALLPPAGRVPCLGLDGNILLTEISQDLLLTARSFAQLRGLADRAEEALRGLGYALTDMSVPEGLPRAMALRFRAVSNGKTIYAKRRDQE